MPWTSTVRRARPHGSSCVTSTAMRARGGARHRGGRPMRSTTSPTSRAPRKTTAPRVRKRSIRPRPHSDAHERSAMVRNAYSQSSPTRAVDADATACAGEHVLPGTHRGPHTRGQAGVLRFLPHQHIDAHAHGGSSMAPSAPFRTRARHPGALELCHEYLCNCLRRGKHSVRSSVATASATRFKTIPVGTRARAPHHHARGFEPDRIEHERGNARAPPARRIRKRSLRNSACTRTSPTTTLPTMTQVVERQPRRSVTLIDPSNRATIGEDANDATPSRSRSFATISARAQPMFLRVEVSNPRLRSPTRALELTPVGRGSDRGCWTPTPNRVRHRHGDGTFDHPPLRRFIARFGCTAGSILLARRVVGSVSDSSSRPLLEDEPDADANAARAPHRYRRLVRDRNIIEFVDHRLGRREKNRSDVLVSWTTTDSRRGGYSRVATPACSNAAFLHVASGRGRSI